MAAFLSGVATAFGLPSRIISDSYVKNTNIEKILHEKKILHMFVEIYGLITLTSNGDPYDNDGWFLIDPANGERYYVYKSSYTPIDDYIREYAVRNNNAHPKPRWETVRLNFIWGMTSNGWGSNVVGTLRQTSWEYYKEAPYYEKYTNNPWDIFILSTY